jgi:curved DNA-binding protein CbpA
LWQEDIHLLRERDRKARRILGVSDTAELEEIKRAWRKEVQQSHPDKKENPGDSAQRFLFIQSAYDFLTKGIGGEELDKAVSSDTESYAGKYRLDNEWGIFLWWREQFFE